MRLRRTFAATLAVVLSGGLVAVVSGTATATLPACPARIEPPARIVIDRPYKSVAIRLVAHCENNFPAWNIQGPAGLDSAVSYQGALRGTRTDHWDLDDSMPMGGYRFTPLSPTGPQATAWTSVRFGAKVTVPDAVRNGNEVCITGRWHRYVPSSAGYDFSPKATLGIQYRAVGSKKWVGINRVLSGGTRCVVVTNSGSFRLVSASSTTVWDAVSGTFRL